MYFQVSITWILEHSFNKRCIIYIKIVSIWSNDVYKIGESQSEWKLFSLGNAKLNQWVRELDQITILKFTRAFIAIEKRTRLDQ